MEIYSKVCSHLAEGAAWHSRTATELRKMPNKRGYARIHDDQASGDSQKLICFNKMLRDHLMISPVPNMQMVAKVETYSINTFDDFKNHFRVWVAREGEYLEVLNCAIDASREKDMTVYHKLCEMAQSVKIEAMRAEWICASLADCGWEKHHCAVVSKWLHDQAETAPGDWNYNIG